MMSKLTALLWLVIASASVAQITVSPEIEASTTKLTGVAAGATSNATDAVLLDRANHTGTQTASTISDFNAAATNAASTLGVDFLSGARPTVGGTNVLLSGESAAASTSYFFAYEETAGETVVDGASTTLAYDTIVSDPSGMFDGSNIVWLSKGNCVLTVACYLTTLGSPGSVITLLMKNGAGYIQMCSRNAQVVVPPTMIGSVAFYNDNATNVYSVTIVMDSNGNETRADENTANFISGYIIKEP